MSTKHTTAHRELQELTLQISEIDRILTQSHEQIIEECQLGLALAVMLTEKLEQLQTKRSAIKKKITKAKAHSKKRKQEIKKWKEWFDSQIPLDKAAELTKLNEEISWRAIEIAGKETEISSLYSELLQAEGACEFIIFRLEAMKEADMNAPIDEDSRIQSLLKEQEMLKAQLEKLSE